MLMQGKKDKLENQTNCDFFKQRNILENQINCNWIFKFEVKKSTQTNLNQNIGLI